jgi:hypothetical protein
MNRVVGENAPLTAVGGATRVVVDREDLDPLNEHHALAVIVRARLHRGIGAGDPRHRAVDRIVDVSLDDEEAGESAGDLVVRGAVRVRVIPVRAGRVRSRGRLGRVRHAAEPVLVVRLPEALVRGQIAAPRARGGAKLPISAWEDAQKRVVADGAVAVDARLDVQAVRVKVGRVRPVRHVDVAANAGHVDHVVRGVHEELVEVSEDGGACGSFLARPPDGGLHPAERGRQPVGVHFERVGGGTSGHPAHAGAEMVSERDAEAFVAPHANRRPRAGPVEAVQRREAVARRDGTRRVRVADNVEREWLAGPVGGPPHPRFCPVLDPQRTDVDNGVRHRRSRKPPLSGAGGLTGR